MADVEFEEDVITRSYEPTKTSSNGLVQNLISWGLAGNERQASILLLVFALLLFIFSTFLITKGAPTPPTFPPEEIPPVFD